MKIEKITEAKEPMELEITGITIPSIEEAEQIPIEYRMYDNSWWLRSQGYRHYYAASVSSGGTVHSGGSNVTYEYDCVRPALKLCNLESSNLYIGDTFIFGGKKFVIVAEDYAFCLWDIGKHCFRDDWEAEDSNDYEKSDIKKFVEAWFRKASKEMDE